MNETPPTGDSQLKRILVADDEEDILWSVRETLTPYYEVDVATSGSEVLQLWDENSYYALIIDVTFDQGVSGLETASAIRSEDKDIRIIVFSAKGYSDSVRQKVVNLGAQFIEKPLVLSDVLEKLGWRS
jgi:DNA-binding NtrC family response regulator